MGVKLGWTASGAGVEKLFQVNGGEEEKLSGSSFVGDDDVD
jgi:hypothetical protein